MPSEIWAALIGVVGTLAGVWYGAWLSRKAARDLLIQQAKAEFAAAFTATLVNLASGQKQDQGQALGILQTDYPGHLAAYIKLRSVLPKEQQVAVDEAWRQYTRDDQNQLPEEREFYRFNHVLGPDSGEHQFMLAAKHVNSLLAKIAA